MTAPWQVTGQPGGATTAPNVHVTMVDVSATREYVQKVDGFESRNTAVRVSLFVGAFRERRKWHLHELAAAIANRHHDRMLRGLRRPSCLPR